MLNSCQDIDTLADGTIVDFDTEKYQSDADLDWFISSTETEVMENSDHKAGEVQYKTDSDDSTAKNTKLN